VLRSLLLTALCCTCTLAWGEEPIPTDEPAPEEVAPVEPDREPADPAPTLRGRPSPEPAPGVDGARFDSMPACRAWMLAHTTGAQRLSIRRFDARYRRCERDEGAWVYRDTHAFLTLDPVLDPVLLIASGVTLAVSRARDNVVPTGLSRWDPGCDPSVEGCTARRDPLAKGLTAPVGRWEEASDGILYASFALAGLPLLTSRGNARLTDTIVMAEVILLDLAVVESIKVRTAEPRPYVFGDLRDFDRADTFELMDDLRGDDAWKSYFSGHTSITAASTFGLATLWALRQRGTKPGWYALPYGLAAGITAVQGTARVLSMRHDPTDVVVGGVAGVLIGTLVPLAHAGIARAIDPERVRPGRSPLRMRLNAGPNSLGVQGVW
jgi:membrane-associated phospholipid phosphatase